MHTYSSWRRGLPFLLAASLLGGCMERPTLVGEIGERRGGADRLVTVIGTGRVAMPPESASFDGLIVSLTPSPAEAWAAGAKTLANVIRALEAAGVGRGDLTMGVISLTQRTDGQWTLHQRLRVHTRDLGQLPDLMGVASSAGARQVEVFRFGIADERAAGDRARERAMVDAQEKAEMLGRELVLRLVEVRSIEELPAGHPNATPDFGLYETTCALRVTFVMMP